MEIEIIFRSSSTPKRIKDATHLYTKGEMVCVQMEDGWIVSYPLVNIFQVAHKHSQHIGTTQKDE